jgi:hypothetical protein
MRRFYWWSTTKVLQIRARPSNAHLDKLHANWIREREKPPEKIDAERCQQAFDNYQDAVGQLFKPFQKGEVVPEGYLGADFRLLLTPHRPNYIYYPEMTDVIVPFDILMSMAVSERIAEILRRFGAEEQAVQLIPVPVYEETTGLYLGRFYLVHYLLRVSGVIVLGEGLETVRIEVARSAVPDAPLFQVQDVEAWSKPEEVVREDVRAALEGAGITGCRFVPIVRVR